MSVFNPTALLNTEFTGALDTTVVPIPEGEFTGVISKVEVTTFDSNKNGQSKTFVVLNVNWDIDDAEVAAVTGRDKNSVRQKIFLDLTDHGTLDMSKGKNVQLGRLREAVGQNQAGKPWSFGMLQGQVATIMVTQRLADDDSGNIYNEVKRVAAM